MERIARRGLRLGWVGLVVILLLGMPTALRAARPVAFNLSTAKTFAPGEKPKVHLYSQNVDELEFRVYRVEDPAKFLSGLKDLHSFGEEESWGPKEQVDERTWLEKFHDWKHHIWFVIRRFFRDQFSMKSRDAMREKQAKLAHRSRVVGVAQFAQIPLLNDRQLVARWRQEMPPTYVSDSQDLPIDPLDAGLYLVEATDGRFKAYTVLFVSEMALVTRTSNGTVLAYAVDRKTGAPLSKVQVRMGIRQQQVAEAETGEDGVAELHGPVSKAMQENIWVVASSGKDVAAVTPASYAYSGSEGSRWASYVYTDRPVYRPGHTVHWKAILRTRIENHLEVPKPQRVHVTVSDEQDHAVLERDITTSAKGTIAGDVELKANASLGYYTIRIGAADDEAGGSFRVEEYRKPEYQVRVSAAKPRVLEGDTMQVTIDSRYFFGEPVANAAVKYKVFHAPHYWWEDEGDDGQGMGPVEDADEGTNDNLGYGADQQSEQTGKLDANGKLTIAVPTSVDGSNRKMDQDYTIEAGVTDAANREVIGRGHFLATYGSFRIHVEPASYAIRQGSQAAFNVTAADYDNHPVQTRVHVALVKRTWENGKTVTTQGPSTDVTTDARGNARAVMAVSDSGSMEVAATATTPENRVVQDTSWLWVMGTGEQNWWGGMSQQLQIIADKKKYSVGDVAHLSLVSPVAGFHALVTATGFTDEFRKVVSSDGKTLTWDMPITSDSVPNLQVNAVFIANDQLYEANKNIKVPPVEKQLQVEITPAKQVFQPQQSAMYDVLLKDSTGKPVPGAYLSFGVVDEAIYSLYPDTSGDMVKRLYPDRYVYAEVTSSLEYSFSGRAGGKSPMLAERKSRYNPRMAQVKPGNDVVQPKVRKAFPDTAYWAPDVRTDAQGHAKITMTFPDSLTTWRATVRALTVDSKAGSQINRVIVRKNVIVRMGTPRFMRKGDEIAIPVIAHNYLDTAKQIQLQLEVHGLDIAAGSSKTVTVPSKGDGVAVWRVKATQMGAARLLAKALTNEESDALEITFPIEPSGVPATIGGNGAITQPDGSAQTAVNFPTNTDAAAHGLHVEISPSIAGSIFPALAYLTSYPYGCTEQTMSSFLPNVIVAETLKKLNVAGRVDENDLKAKVQAGLDRLKDYQHDDGGWGWWKEDDSRVFMTAYVVSGLAEASRSLELDANAQSMKQKGAAYLEKQLADHPRMLPELRAYTVYALIEVGQTNHGGDLDTLYGRRNDLSAEGLAMLGLAMVDVRDSRVDAIAKLVESKVQRQGELASWPSRYSPLLDFEFDNSAESTAYAMRLLTKADPKSPLLDAAAQWLVLNRTSGYWWDSTEQTSMVLFGLVDYMAESKELNADFDVDVLVNGASVAKRHFSAVDAMSGADMEVDVAAEELQGNNNVQIVKRGQGKAYWAVQGRYFSTETKLYQSGTMNLNLTRDYFKLVAAQKNSKVVYQLQPLRGAVQVGDVLAVHLAVNGSAMKYLLIEDPIPAGTEFVTNEDSYNIVDRPGNWEWWYTRREFHDDRVAMFATEFEGRHESFYLLKVVNAGAFVVSPAHVEPMYQPGVQATTEELRMQADPSPDEVAAPGVHP